MTEPQQLKALLTLVADDAGEFRPPDLGVIRDARPPRADIRRTVAIAAVVVTVIIVSLVVAITVVPRGQHAAPTQRYNPDLLPGPRGPVVTAHQLEGYHWQALPPAPIAPRDPAASAWTGTEMIVWGGATTTGPTTSLMSDGAAYSPTTHRWTKLPPAPLVAREDAVSAWADGRLVIWGGDPGVDRGALRDGATYDPDTNTWQKMAPSPVNLKGYVEGFAVGSRVIFLAFDSPLHSTTVHTFAYQVGSNSWHRLPALHLPEGHPILRPVGLAVGNILLFWSEWDRFEWTDAAHDSSTDYTGVDSYALDTTSGSWSPAHLEPGHRMAVNTPLWTGRQLLIAGQTAWLGRAGAESGPFTTGEEINPRTHVRTQLPQTLYFPGGNYVWTGGALLALNSTLLIQKPRQRQVIGAVMVWNPSSNAWTTLHAERAYGAVVWTGSELLVWGEPGQSRAVPDLPDGEIFKP
jgi:hypothetical protein